MGLAISFTHIILWGCSQCHFCKSWFQWFYESHIYGWYDKVDTIKKLLYASQSPFMKKQVPNSVMIFRSTYTTQEPPISHFHSRKPSVNMKLNLILLVLISLVLAFCSFSESKKVRKIKRLPSPARLTKYPQHTRFQRPRRPRNKKRTPHGKSKHRHPKPEPDHVSTRKSEMFLRAAAAPASSSNAVLDVGQVTVVSISQSCNGVLLDPSLVLTSASCVYLNHNSKAYAEINFVLNRVVKKVKEVYGIPEWLRSGERKADFALLLLARPMTNIQSALTSLTWSPYALEDIGESFLATPSPSSCRTASKKAQNTQIIRDVGDNIITVSCGNAGMASAGSPFYRRVGGRNVIYGVYFGQCTSGSMDRKTSGLCGSRITKQVFEDFCTLAKSEQIDLPDCSSKLLTSCEYVNKH